MEEIITNRFVTSAESAGFVVANNSVKVWFECGSIIAHIEFQTVTNVNEIAVIAAVSTNSDPITLSDGTKLAVVGEIVLGDETRSPTMAPTAVGKSKKKKGKSMKLGKTAKKEQKAKLAKAKKGKRAKDRVAKKAKKSQAKKDNKAKKLAKTGPKFFKFSKYKFFD